MIGLLFLMIAINPAYNATPYLSETNLIQTENSCNTDCSYFVKQLLFPTIMKTIDTEYGFEERSFFNLQILDICPSLEAEDGNSTFKITVSFETFCGPHNPPYDKNIAVYELEIANEMKFTQIEFKRHSIDELTFDR